MQEPTYVEFSDSVGTVLDVLVLYGADSRQLHPWLHRGEYALDQDCRLLWEALHGYAPDLLAVRNAVERLCRGSGLRPAARQDMEALRIINRAAVAGDKDALAWLANTNSTT